MIGNEERDQKSNTAKYDQYAEEAWHSRGARYIGLGKQIVIRSVLRISGSMNIGNDAGNDREKTDDLKETSDDIVYHGITHVEINITVHEEFSRSRGKKPRQ